jgi:hypothetical protein
MRGQYKPFLEGGENEKCKIDNLASYGFGWFVE